MGQHDASHVDDHPGGEPGEPDEPDEYMTSSRDAMAAAAAGWMRRGYVVRYRDPYLSQLMRREPLGWREALLLALAAGASIAAVIFALRAFRRRLWHVVTLVIRPDGRIVTHQIRAPHPPAP